MKGQANQRSKIKANIGTKRRAEQQSALPNRASETENLMLRLQQTVGNRAAQDFVRGSSKHDTLDEKGTTSLKDLKKTSLSPGNEQAAKVGSVAGDGLKNTVIQREGPSTSIPDFDELEYEYKNAREKEHSLYSMRETGNREAEGNLREEDAPSIADIILKAAIMGALGYASGGISMVITKRVADGASEAIENAIQSGIDDAIKDAVPALVETALKDGTTSKSSYFAGIEIGIIKLREEAVLKLNEQELKAKEKAKRDPTSLAESIRAVRRRKEVVDSLKKTAQDVQYKESLSKWMVAMAQGELGTDGKLPGTAMANMPGHGEDPIHFFKRGSTPGVLRLTFGLKPAERPLTINAALLEGLNDTTKARLKDIKLRDLGFPIFAQGWIYDGFFDALKKGDNEVTMSMNEARTVFVNYGSDAEDAMKSEDFAQGKTEVVDIARDILDNDIGNLTLGSLNLR